MDLEETYNFTKREPSDISQHLPKLREYAEKCEHITEFGFRWGCSTYAFLAARPKRLVSYDIVAHEATGNVARLAKENGISFDFFHQDVLKVEIEETDLLFIDTEHSKEQCEQELALHAGKVRKYLIFHDTATYWEKWDRDDNGLRYAIEPFMEKHPEWNQVYRAENNNGLLILEKQ